MSSLDDEPPGVPDAERDQVDATAPDVPVTAHQSTPGRTVFVEEGNTEGWIASSLTVRIED
jgi:hypothetical protein